MGLEALVESYAFWRPSLRTLTFEDIPGIPKQGKSQSLRVIYTASSCLEAQSLKNVQVTLYIYNGSLVIDILL